MKAPHQQKHNHQLYYLYIRMCQQTELSAKLYEAKILF